MTTLCRQSLCALAIVCATGFASTAVAQQPEPDEPVPDAAEQDAAEQDAAEEGAAEDSGTQEDGSRASGTAQAADGQGTSFTLDELTNKAINNSDLVDEYRAKRAKAKWDKYRAEHAWSPRIKSTTFLSVVPDNADPDEINENFDEIGSLDIGPYIRSDLEVIVPVYTFGRVDIAKELAELGVDNSALELANARLDVVYQTKRAYWGLRLSNAFAEMLGEGDKIIKEQLEKMEEDREFGAADFEIKDFRKLEIFSAEVDERVVDNAKLGEVASAGLHFLAEIPDDVEIELPKLDNLDSPPKLRAKKYYIDTAMKQRPEILQLDKAVRARSLESELATAEWYPNLFAAFTVGAGWSTKETAFQRVCAANSREDATECDFPEDQFEVDGQGLYAEPYGDPLHRFSLGIGLGLRWEFDPFQQYAKVEKKDAQVLAIRAQRRRAQSAIKLEVRKLYQDAADSLQKIAINKRRMTAARRWRDQFGLSRQTGAADIADAVQPLQAYYEARAKYLQAVFDYMVARGALAKAVGAYGLGEDGAVLSD
ncbi:TolC family protein [Persicimonas caeni]|uniref:TolC family protein n=1 Tax=Persicimonas caeni TaxID=2292766 RepID=A0A4Y6Q2M8_PERCE|nr:TolC family protein [Persicimonas caeni]QDG54437.1 TolC family protein [Persicimonas caeni]QED35658.1 TolC family protein [Persicimonas caeni]